MAKNKQIPEIWCAQWHLPDWTEPTPSQVRAVQAIQHKKWSQNKNLGPPVEKSYRCMSTFWDPKSLPFLTWLFSVWQPWYLKTDMLHFPQREKIETTNLSKVESTQCQLVSKESRKVHSILSYCRSSTGNEIFYSSYILYLSICDWLTNNISGQIGWHVAPSL